MTCAALPGPRTVPGRLGALVAALCVVGGLLGQPPAAAAAASTPTQAVAATTPAVFPVPASGSFAVVGHGSGHGHGLSQYGAQGAGLHGVALSTILDHYYPGTTLGPLPDSPVRVLLTATVAPAGVMVVSPAAGLSALDEATGRRVLLPAGPVLWRAARAADGSFRLQGLGGGATPSWTNQLLLGAARAGPLAFSSAGTVRLWPAAGTVTDVRGLPSRAYRGRLELRTTGSGGTAVIDVVPMESYLRAVVPLESSSSWPDVTLQAQAVAARSYAANKRGSYATSRSFDVYDTTADQSYGGAITYSAAGTATAREAPSTDRAITATSAKALLYAGRPAFTQFGASDGGWSADGGAPYLAAAADPWERAYSTNPLKDWSGSVSAARLEDAAGRPRGWLSRLAVTSRDGHGDWGGRVLLVRLDHVAADGSVSSVELSGSAVQRAGGLDSTYFTVTSPQLGSVAITSVPALFVPVTPVRALDTRRGGGRLSVTARTIALAGVAGVPRTGVSAVALETTLVAPTATTGLTLWPAGDSRPTIAGLLTVAGQGRAGHAVVRLGAGGSLSAALDAGQADLVLDVVGYYPAGPAPGAARLVVPTARRLLDTRATQPLGPGESRGLLVRSAAGAPAQASAVVLNLTAVGATSATYLSATGLPGRPTVSCLAESAAGTVANTVVVPVAADGRVWLYNNSGRVQVVADLLGWYLPPVSPAQGRTATTAPTMLLDTRTGLGGRIGALPGGSSATVGATASGLLPTGTPAVLVVLCARAPSGATVLTLTSGGAPMPRASHLNASRDHPACNTVPVPLSSAGTLTVADTGAATDVTVAVTAITS